MKRMLAAGFSVATLLTLVSCGGSPAPTSPSTSLPGASLSVIGPGSSTNLTVAWSCLTQGVGCPARVGQLAPSPAALIAPGAPGNLMASVNGSTVSLGWTGPTSGDSPTSYVIEAGSAPGASNLVVFDTGSAGQGFTATSVPAGTYYVRVLAKNGAGTGGATNEVIVTVSAGGPGPCTGAPGAPTNLAVSIDGSTVSFTWTVPAGGCAPTTYGVEAGSSPGASNLANIFTGNASTSFAASNVPAGTYYVRVRAGNGSTIGGVSNEVTVIVGGSTPSPTSVTGTWVGLAPDGWIFPPDPACGAEEFDLTLDLTQTGTNVTGTFTNRVRVSRCKTVGRTTSAPLMTGSVGSGTISFTIHGGGANEILTFMGTFTATRMTGTTTPSDDPSYKVSFAVNRQ